MADDQNRDNINDNDDEIIASQLAGDQHSAVLDDEVLHGRLVDDDDGDERTALTAAHQGPRVTSTPEESEGAPAASAANVNSDVAGQGANIANIAADSNGTETSNTISATMAADSIADTISEQPVVNESETRGVRATTERSTDQFPANNGPGVENQAPLESEYGANNQQPRFESDESAELAGVNSPDSPASTPSPTTPPAPQINTGPTTADAAATGAEDAASIAVTISGSDTDGTVDSFSLSSLPTNGTLYLDAGLTAVAATGADYVASGGSLTLYFVPDADFNGDVTFDYAATDDDNAVDATPATTTITVTPVAETIDGTPHDDSLVGTGEDEIVNGLAGDDTLIGNGGADVLNGDQGKDLLDGGAGDDTLNGGTGDDTLSGGAGADVLDGGNGSGDVASYESSGSGVNVDLTTGTGSGGDAQGDTLTNIEDLVGSSHDDTLTGDANANVMDGGAGDDSIAGGDGKDTLSGGVGNDTMEGGLDNDEFEFSDNDFDGGAWTDVIDGGAGNVDVINLSDVTQGWTLEVDGAGPGVEASSGDNPSQYVDTDGFSGTITFDDGSTVVFDNIEKVDW